MTYSHFIKEHGVTFGISLSALVAVFLSYLTFPSIVSILIPNATSMLWASPLSFRQGISIFIGMFAISMMLAVTHRVKLARNNGEALIPIWLIALVISLLSVLITSLIAIFAFESAFNAMLTIGVESSFGIFIGLMVAILVIWILK